MSQTLTYVIGQGRRPHVDNVQDFKVNFDGSNTNWVQARQYERSMRQVFVNIKNEDGTPLDLTGCNVWFEGLLPKNSAGDFRVIDDKGYVALDPTAGRFRFDMPGHAFTVAGSYRQAFFRILKDGNSITTLEFDLDVLADKVIDGLVPRTYISPVEELLNEIEAKYQDSTDKLTKMTSDFVDKFTQSMETLKALGVTVQNGLDALQDKINSEHLFTEDEADAFKKSIQKLIDAQGEDFKTLTDKVNSNELLLSGYNVRDFGAVGDGETDDTVAIQKAITQVALDWKKDNFKTNLVVMPAGRYKVTSTIILPPYVKLISAGLVTIESYIDDDSAIHIQWLGDDDPDIIGKGLGNAYQNQDWQRGYIIDGTQGGFSLVAKEKTDNNAGIELGFRSDAERGNSNLKNVARSGLNNIAIGNYGIGLKLNGADLFIFNFVNMHIENNGIDVQNGYAGENYGENIYFDRCVICNADKVAINQLSGGFDLTFNECSLGNNKLLFSNSSWQNNNITIISGNLEGNEVIYDGSKGVNTGEDGSISWMASLNIISSNIYIRQDETSGLKFKGPLILNLDNPYIISGLNEIYPNYLCDENVFVTYNRNPIFSRMNSHPLFVTERDNVIKHGYDMSKIDFDCENKIGELVTSDSGLYPELAKAGFTSALSYTRKSTGTKNWEFFVLKQKINVSGKSTFLFQVFGEAHKQYGNVNFLITFYDENGTKVGSRTFYPGISRDTEVVLYAGTAPQKIPVDAVSATIAFSASCTDEDAGFQYAYLGMEME